MKLKPPIRLFAFLGMITAICLLTAACRNELVFTTATKVGLDISQRADQQPEITFGYDRTEVVSIPVSGTNKVNDACCTNDCYSVVGSFCVSYKAYRKLTINQCFATGIAARMATTNPALAIFYGTRMGQIAAPTNKPNGANNN